MKIVHLETGRHLYGGAQQVVYLLEGLQQRGHESILICTENSAIAERARSIGCRIFPLACAGDLDLEFMLRVRQLLRQQKPDLVHLHSRRGADTLGLLAARWTHTPAVISRRVDNPESPWLVRLKYGQSGAVIAISEAIRAILLKSGVPAERVHCVHSAVIAERFRNPRPKEEFIEEFGLCENDFTIAVVAQLIERKNHLHLLRALAAVRDELAPGKVIFFGQGPLEEKLGVAVKNLGLTDRVLFAGFRDDLPNYLAHIDLLVHPAAMEGLGVSLIEAAAAGVPIVANPAGGIPEIVRDGENGLLVNCADPTILGQAILGLQQNDTLRKAFGLRGRQIVDQFFSVDAMVEGNLAVYQRLLDQN